MSDRIAGRFRLASLMVAIALAVSTAGAGLAGFPSVETAGIGREAFASGSVGAFDS